MVTETSANKQAIRIEIAPRTILMLLGVVAGVWLLAQLTNVISVVLFALVLVGALEPVVAWVQRHGVPRGRALVVVFTGVALALAGIILLMIPPLVGQLLQIVGNAPKAREQLVQTLHGYSGAQPVIDAINDVPLDHLASSAAPALIGYSSSVFLVIGYGFSALFLAIYLLADPTRAKGFVYAVVPRRYHVKLATILVELKIIVGGYIRGQLITSLAISCFVFLLLTLFGASNALAIALFAGLTDVIPFIGGYLASTPVVLAVIPHGIVSVVIVAAVMILYQELENRLLVPRVYGRVLRIPPAMVIVALLIGGTLAGILGALLALPVAAGIQMLVRELRVDLPGEAPASEELLQKDVHASEVYADLTVGTTATDAAVIADEVATLVKKGEDIPDLPAEPDVPPMWDLPTHKH